MKILLYGESDKVGSGAWCYAETLRQMGHRVIGFDPWWELHRYLDSYVWRGYRRLLGQIRETDRRRHVDRLKRLAVEESPELIIVLKGLLLSTADLEELRLSSKWIVNINHDDFFSRNPNNWSTMQREALSSYDYIFTTREINVPEVSSYNRNVEFFPFAYNPQIHRPIARTEPEDQDVYNTDVIFVGTWERQRSEWMEQLVKNVPARYAIFGAQWEKAASRSVLRPFIHNRELIGDEMARALGAAKISLGFLRKENRDDYTQRTLEIPACGGVLLAERTERHLSWFKEGEEAEFFAPEGPEELCAKVELLLGDSVRRESIRIKGRARVIKGHHTYCDRLTRLLELYERHQIRLSSAER